MISLSLSLKDASLFMSEFLKTKTSHLIFKLLCMQSMLSKSDLSLQSMLVVVNNDLALDGVQLGFNYTRYIVYDIYCGHNNCVTYTSMHYSVTHNICHHV